MTGLLAIWAACAFWVIVLPRICIEKSRRNQYWRPMAIIVSVIMAPYFYTLWMRYLYKDSK